MKNNTNKVGMKLTQNFQVVNIMKRLLFITLFSLILSAVSYADISPTGPNTFVAGVNSSEFQYFAAPETAGIQRQDQWCWAASIQMVLNYHGLYVTQERIVQIVKGQLVNDGGTHDEMIYALNGWGPDNRGRFSKVTAFTDNKITAVDLINKLAYKYPMIAELSNSDGSGHAVVLTAVGFHNVAVWNGYQYVNSPVLDYAIIRDPWGRNGTQSRQVIQWSSFQSRVRNLDQVFVNRY